jgi:MYXO-CTERM domain-containing protein
MTRRICLAAILAALTAVLVPSIASAQLGGPNAFGYTYDVTSYDYVQPGLLDTPLTLADDDEVTVALPWTFEYYGVDYSDVVVGSNGGIRFTTGAIDYINDCLPISGDTPHIAPFWTDLDPSSILFPIGQGVFAQHDTAGNRFLITWEMVPLLGLFAGDGSFQIQLYPNGDIELHFADLDYGDPTIDDGAGATIGIQDVDGSDPLEVVCNGADPTLEGSALLITGCEDGDGDGYCDGEDCDDADPAVNPGALEVCDDGIDDNCDGVDEASDDDGDTYIDIACVGGDDCDDDDPAMHPGIDVDGDGWSLCDDCNDNVAIMNPGVQEICDDGIDNDCSGIDETADEDGDTYGNAACGGDDCDDTDPAINPSVDVDGDTYNACEDCDDSDAAINPDGVEVCDGDDNDCDGISDNVDADGDGAYPPECGGDDCNDADPLASPDYDGDGDGSSSCDDCDDTDPDVSPIAVELCDGIDSDCDGLDDGQDFDIGGGGPGLLEVGPAAAVAIADVATVTSVQTATTSSTSITDVNVAVDITHSYVGDLTVTLESPAGTTITLFDAVGGAGIDFIGTVLDDEASASIVTAAAPFTGSFMPETALSAFDGEDPNGDWTLSVTDGAAGDTGTLDEWTLTFEFNSTADLDGDGWVNDCAAYGDCDDADPAIYPGAPETCGDAIDQNCDGIDQTGDEDADGYVDADCGGDDCDDSDPGLNPGVDGDGDGSSVCEDCDDANPDNFPGNPEVCADGIDQNCDGADDLGDEDGDGYINEACIGGDDCDDTDAFFNPGLDSDGDGSNFCEDCNDSDELQSPDFEEICGDFIDNDCSGEADDLADEDGDGFDGCEDCDETDVDVNPDADEVCDDGTDQDCDGSDLLGDVDGDGVASDLCGGDDCDDDDPAVFPGADEACDGVDLNCDGDTTAVDEDGDGHFDAECGGLDCDDDMQGVHPDAPEICNGIDDDCDGVFAEGGEDDLDGDLFPACEDCDDDDPEIFPGADELCDAIDNDCDGEADENIVRDGDSDGHLKESCGGDDCDDSNSGVHPGAFEDCADGLDNNCDGLADEDDPECDFGPGGCDCSNSLAGGDARSGLAGLLLLGLVGLRRRQRS